jgi:hypothetical protein
MEQKSVKIAKGNHALRSQNGFQGFLQRCHAGLRDSRASITAHGRVKQTAI